MKNWEWAGNLNGIVDKSHPEPLYIQIKDWMLQEIETGRWPEHYKLPAEEDLAQALAVSRGTLRRALQELIALRRLRQIQGKGTFVMSGGHVEQQLAEQLVTVSEELIGAHTPFETEVIAQAVVPPSQRVGSMLSIPPGQYVFYLKRLRRVGGRALILFENYVALDRCPQIQEVNFTQVRLFEALEERFGLELDWGSRIFEAQAATPEVAQWLALAPAAPVMYLEQVVYLRNGLPIEMSDVWFRGDSFRVSATLKRRGGASPRTSALEYVTNNP